MRPMSHGGPARPGIGNLIQNLLNPGAKAGAATTPGTVLVLTPVKNALTCLDGYCEQLRRLTWPHDKISLGFLESDSADGTFEAL